MNKEEFEMMGKIERKILKYLEKDKDKKFNVVAISKGIKHGYPATLKYVMILEARRLINVEDYGNVKQVSYKEGTLDGL